MKLSFSDAFGVGLVGAVSVNRYGTSVLASAIHSASAQFAPG